MAKPADKIRYAQVNVLSELERYFGPGSYVWAGDDEVKVKCPFHDDQSPSCDVSLSKRLFNCHAASCGKKGDIVTLLAGAVKRPRGLVLEELSTRYDLDDVKIVDPSTVERWHAKIWQAGPLLAELRKRDITDDDIRGAMLGEDDGRVTIPIDNDRGDWVNVRKYLPGAPGQDKMRNMRGRGSARFYPGGQLRYDEVVLCGGEMKALRMRRACNKHGVGAVCMTVNEGLLPPELLKQLSGKIVHVLLDIDEGGRRATELNLRALMPLAAEVYDATAQLCLRLDAAQHPTGDVNDFAATGADPWLLVEASRDAGPWKPPAGDVQGEDEEPTEVHLSRAVNADFAGRRVRVSGIVTAMDTAPYVVPKDIEVKCDKSQQFCAVCPVWPSQDGRFKVNHESPAILEVVSADKSKIHVALIGAVGIPKQCRVCDFKVHSYYNAEDTRLSPSLEITSRASDQKVQPAICLGEGLEPNEPYEFTGRMWPNPKTQQSTLLISSYKPTRDALSTYAPGGEQLRDLEQFRPADPASDDSIAHKLEEIYGDLERNVTRIRQRTDMHLAMDLCWHSPLLLRCDGRRVKGWSEVLVLGDSAQGKSECAGGLMRHYGLGEKLECKNATVAGLLGGLQQMGTRWFVTWGFIPTHDRRLVHLEELKGAHTDVIGKLTEMRSSGIAELTKIEKRRTHARTRLLATSNPRTDGRTLASYAFGIEAVRELIGGLEDVRRFDLCYCADERDVSADAINAPWPENGHQEFPGELCRRLVLWAWTRTDEQCEMPPETWAAVTEEATRLSGEFSSAIPVVDSGSARYKVARLAAALAARTFSSDETGQRLVITPAHVRYVANFLRRHYSSRAFGYAEFTEAVRSTQAIHDPDGIKATLASLPFPYDFVESLLRCERIELQDLMDWCGWDRPQASQMLSVLVRKHALRRDNRCYRKTGAFIALLKDIAESRGMPDRPNFIAEPEF